MEHIEKKEYRDDKNQIIYFEIDYLQLDYSNELHQTEKLLIDTSIELIEQMKDSNEFLENKSNELPNNSLIISFCVRDVSNQTFNNIHCTLLWKKTSDKIIIFDPNKKEFSKIITDYLQNNELFKFDFEVPDYDEFYNYPKNKNFKYQKQIDCLNLCIVMALELNESHLYDNININNIESQMIDKLTNISDNINDNNYKRKHILYNKSSFLEQYSFEPKDRNTFQETVKNNLNTNKKIKYRDKDISLEDTKKLEEQLK
jgi:hypothetical protein